MGAMLQTFANVITPEEQAELCGIARETAFVSGVGSASPRLAGVKHNEQMAQGDPSIARVARIVGVALGRHSAFRAATLPRQMHSLRLSRYSAGMHYGKHVDAAVMVDGAVHARADLSFTLFLSDPASYAGGELSLETGSGDARFKLPARHLLCYPTGQLHEVREVTEGERLVVIGWVQSLVRDPQQRETLWDLSVAMELVHASEGKSRAYDLLVKSHANLLRQWGEV
ncbi:MAG: Fe2+-dependent dioxygenase [Polyangiales bacterium]|nr:Fe2+-dependent dioxygenase [Sandaracinaceae bacterium]